MIIRPVKTWHTVTTHVLTVEIKNMIYHIDNLRIKILDPLSFFRPAKTWHIVTTHVPTVEPQWTETNIFRDR